MGMMQVARARNALAIDFGYALGPQLRAPVPTPVSARIWCGNGGVR
jgi:hypothetical protein